MLLRRASRIDRVPDLQKRKENQSMRGKGGQTLERALLDEANKQGVETEGQSVKEAEQQELLKRESRIVPTVNGNKFCVRFVKPAAFEKDESDERKVELEFSTSLTADHDDLLNSNVMNWVKCLRKYHAGGVKNIEIPNQTIAVFLGPEMPEKLKVIAVPVRHVCLDWIVEKGSGKENKVLRFGFRAVADANQEVMDLIRTNCGDSLWISMGAAQGRLEDAA
jgi:hypothetical protein